MFVFVYCNVVLSHGSQINTWHKTHFLIYCPCKLMLLVTIHSNSYLFFLTRYESTPDIHRKDRKCLYLFCSEAPILLYILIKIPCPWETIQYAYILVSCEARLFVSHSARREFFGLAMREARLFLSCKAWGERFHLVS